MYAHRFLAFFTMALVGCSCTTLPKIQDTQSAVAANDLTALISGCGQNQVGVGYLVCREIEGGETHQEFLYIHAPPNLSCDDSGACVYFKIFYPDGRPTYEGNIKKGEAFAKIPLSALVDKSTFDLSDRDFYGISITLKYKSSDGIERKTYADGYLFLHVVRKNYVSLLEAENDEAFVWQWQTKENQTIKMTTGFRVFVSTPIASGT